MSNPDDATVELVLRRSGFRCEVCRGGLFGQRGERWALHHRRGRDGAPDSHTPQNLMVVHGADNVTECHGRIHRNRNKESRLNGWLITRIGVQRDPLLVPVLIGVEALYLTADGGYEQAPPGVAA